MPRLGFLMCLLASGCANAAGGSGTHQLAPDAGSGFDLPPGYDIPIASGIEACGDGFDNNGDGRADEACSCTIASTQACWNGQGAQRGRGNCRDGVQTCVPEGEFGGWGGCMGTVLPTDEIPGNCIDEDCDGRDPGCTTCSDEFGEVCSDGIENDCDGLTDCADPDCMGDAACTCSQEHCTNGRDDDCDGMPDCNDPDCQRCAPGATRWCDDPNYCNWGRQVCGPDGNWGVCVEIREHPPGCDPFLGLDWSYDTECCVESGACCQNYPLNDSVGNCAGVSICGS